MNIEELIKQLQAKGTQVVGADMCTCSKCVARRKKHGMLPMEVIPEESDDPIPEANRKMAIKRVSNAMGVTNRTQRKRKNKNNKKKEK